MGLLWVYYGFIMGLWWFMMVYDGFMMVYDEFMMVCDGLWWFLMVFDGLWWFLMVYSLYMFIPDGHIAATCWNMTVGWWCFRGFASQTYFWMMLTHEGNFMGWVIIHPKGVDLIEFLVNQWHIEPNLFSFLGFGMYELSWYFLVCCSELIPAWYGPTM